MHCINAELSKSHAEAAISRAKQEMDALAEVLATGDVDCDALRQQLSEKQQSVEGLRARVQELGQTELTTLLQDMAALQITRVLHGDYDLKIARQDYFTSKQDEVDQSSFARDKTTPLLVTWPCLFSGESKVQLKLHQNLFFKGDFSSPVSASQKRAVIHAV